MDAGHYRELLRPLYAGRRCVLYGAPLAATTPLVRLLRELGADRCLVLASGEGTGTLPSQDDADWVDLDVRASDIIAESRQLEALLANPPTVMLKALEGFDPERRALVLLPPVILTTPPPALRGRRLVGRRTPASIALEDKVVIDAFWDAFGIRRAPAAVVAVDASALGRASAALDRGAGAVWAGDAREGVHGGGIFLRWVRTPEGAEEARAFFAARCDRVRVMPFLEGIPCSIHGLVFPDTVAAFRPVEMVTLRPLAGNRLRYAGAATFWDPPEADRVYMRETARRVGQALRERIGFRGAFTIDGVMTEEGFLPTELNPRFGAGLGVLGRSVPDLPLALLAWAVMEGERLDYQPGALEHLVVEAADARRTGGGGTVVETARGRTEEHRLVAAENGYRSAQEQEQADAVLALGPSAVGGYVRFTPDPQRTPVGPSIAGRVVEGFAFADREFGAGIGPLKAARPVR
jgi:hypothetical protein